jgi:hypothetical protein
MGKWFVGCVVLKDIILKEGMKMKKLIAASFLVAIMAASLTGQVIAKNENNGFPSGPHYNLNIIGKKAHFTCPAQEYYWRVIECGCGSHNPGDLVESCDPLDTCEETTIPIYGNVIFVPENGQRIEILMQSGRQGGKGKKNADLPDELQVIDPCTAAFDGDAAVLQLPKNEAGYRVYARALAKPTDNPDITITPELIAVEDEDGNDLIYLGLVTDNGFETPSATFVRKKGKSKAVDITGLFLWSGTVCYLSDPGAYDDTRNLCCIDTDADGIYDQCIDATLDPITLEPVCPVDYTSVLAYCRAYTDEWVFNIGDFVTYLWNSDNNGVKLLQVRFYPNNGDPGFLAPSLPRTPDLGSTNLTTTWGNIKNGD